MGKIGSRASIYRTTAIVSLGTDLNHFHAPYGGRADLPNAKAGIWRAIDGRRAVVIGGVDPGRQRIGPEAGAVTTFVAEINGQGIGWTTTMGWA
jgi:hypothetical protein